jgi:hypothetical protein
LPAAASFSTAVGVVDYVSVFGKIEMRDIGELSDSVESQIGK